LLRTTTLSTDEVEYPTGFDLNLNPDLDLDLTILGLPPPLQSLLGRQIWRQAQELGPGFEKVLDWLGILCCLDTDLAASDVLIRGFWYGYITAAARVGGGVG
jgi:hypothetical protein